MRPARLSFSSLVLTSLFGFASTHCAVDGASPSRPGPEGSDPPSSVKPGDEARPAAVVDPELGTASFLQPRGNAAPVLDSSTTPEAAALAVIESHAASIGITTPDEELQLESIAEDTLGMTHVTFRQVASGIPVYGMRYGVHFDRAGRTAYVSGRYVAGLSGVSLSAGIDDSEALSLAKADLAMQVAPATLTEEMEPPTTQPVVWAIGGDHPTLAYEVELAFSKDEVVAMHYVIDAGDGSILERTPAMRSATTEGSGAGVLFHARGEQTDIKTFVVTSIGTEASPDGIKYRMTREGTPDATAITVRDRTLAFPYWVESKDPNQWDLGGISPGQAVDGYVHLEMVDHYHRTVHGRASYDGAGSPMTVFAHDPIAYDNAAWYKGRLYSGDIVLAAPDAAYVACLDVVAHEFQHGVNGATLDLVYESQSGAIDEALADIFGSFVEHHYAPHETNNVLIAEASTLPHRAHPIRNLMDPASQGDPDHMDVYENLPVDEDNDLGGVHVNSTIVSHAWYLMTVGGTHARSQVTVSSPIGWEESEQLFNAVVEGRAQAPTASFADFARVVIATAYQLQSASGTDQLPAVPEAGDDGEIAPPPSPVRAVGCAWHAVGVLQEDELAEHWGIRCDDDAGEAPTLDCFTGGQKCGDDQVCAWNGSGSGYCCKAPWEGERTCFTDKECAPGICSRGAENTFYCTEPDAQPCEASSAAAE